MKDQTDSFKVKIQVKILRLVILVIFITHCITFLDRINNLIEIELDFRVFYNIKVALGSGKTKHNYEKVTVNRLKPAKS